MAAPLIIGLNEISQKIGGVDTGVEKGQIFNIININMFVFLSLKMGGFSCNLTPFDQMWPFRCESQILRETIK